MLSFIVSESARGVNLAGHYPIFHRRLQKDPALRKQFQDSLDLLLQTQANTLEHLPGPPSQDLYFLKTRPRPECSVESTESGGWDVILKLGKTQLNTLFSPLPVEPATRHGLRIGLDEDNWFTLFRETVETSEGSWRVVLEGTPIDEPKDALKLAVMVMPVAGQNKKRFRLRATLIWGECAATVAVDERGHASFPWIRLESVLDESRTRISDDLVLTLAGMLH
jgi:hypothetical protein